MASVKENAMIHRGTPRAFAENTLFLDCWIINNLIPDGSKGHYIPLMFSPNSISDSVATSYNSQAIPGGSAPVVTYSSTGARQVSIDFFVPIDYLPSNTSYENTEEYLNALRALMYPKYSGNVVKSPSCTLYLTNITIDGVCTQCNISYKTDQRYGNDGALGAEVSLTIMEVERYLKGSEEVAGSLVALGENNVGVYEAFSIINESPNKKSQGDDFTEFRLNGNALVYAKYKNAGNNQYTPDYIDPGCKCSSNVNVVKFYYVSPITLSFTGSDIKGENPSGKSAIYKICINGESYSKSDKVLERNVMPKLTADQIRTKSTSGINKLFYYIVYVKYNDLSNYDFDTALIRCIECEGSLD